MALSIQEGQEEQVEQINPEELLRLVTMENKEMSIIYKHSETI